MAAPDGYEPRHLHRPRYRLKGLTTTGTAMTLSSWPSADYTVSTPGTGNSYYVGMEFSSQYVGKHRP